MNLDTICSHEATLRLDHESARFAGELGRLEQTNEALTDRLGAFLEQLRCAFERMDKLEALGTFADETRESLQRASVEREQMVQRVAAMEHLASQLAEASAEFGQTLAKLEQRSQAQGVEMLAQAGSPPDSVHTDATVTLRPVDGKPTITKIDLVTVGRVPGLDEAAFVEHAKAAKAGCLVSRALAAVAEITLEASLTT